VPLLWPALLGNDLEICFAAPSFLWRNLASNKAAVTVSIIGMGTKTTIPKKLFDEEKVQLAAYIGPYLVPDHDTVVQGSRTPLSELTPMTNGSMPNDGGSLLLDVGEYEHFIRQNPETSRFLRRFLGSHDSIQGDLRYCIWIPDGELEQAMQLQFIESRVQNVRKHRLKSDREETNELAAFSHAFGERRHQSGRALLIPRHSSERRPYLPSVVVSDDTVIGDSAIAMYDFGMPDLALYSSRLHLVWIATVCGKIKEDYRYSNSLGWNTFPVPKLTEQDKADLTRCAEDILLAREAHFPATIADSYDPEFMPENLRAAHDRNDETLERIYIGRRFKNDTERLATLFVMYEKMTEGAGTGLKGATGKQRGRKKKEVQA
jgi:hypothetical protein